MMNDKTINRLFALNDEITRAHTSFVDRMGAFAEILEIYSKEGNTNAMHLTVQRIKRCVECEKDNA